MRRLIATALTFALFLTALAQAGPEASVSQDVRPGIRASLKHRVIVEQETWPSALMETRAGRALLRLEAEGGFRLHVHVREHPGDYLICVIYMSERDRLVLDEASRFVLRYGDTEVESLEILFTEGPAERRVYSTLDGPIVLSGSGRSYARARSGGYLAAIRFPKDALPEGGEWVPDAFSLRGGEGLENAHDQSLSRACDYPRVSDARPCGDGRGDQG